MMKHTSYLLFFFGAVMLSPGLLKAQNQGKRVEIVGHRGASYLAPENTLASARLAWKVGADGTELDIHMTADKRIVVIHDGNTFRTTGKNLKVSDINYDDLKGLDAGSFKSPAYKGEPIPLLTDILDALPAGRSLYIEIKAPVEVLPFLFALIDKHPKIDQIRIIAFDFETIAKAKELFQNVPCYFLKSKVRKQDYQDFVKLLLDNNLDGADLQFRTINPELVSLLNKNGLECLAWTVDSVDVSKKLVSWGVSGITTNKPGFMKEQL